MWKTKLVLGEGDALVHKAARSAGFMGETDINTYSIMQADGNVSGAVRVEHHTAVRGFKRTITVVQTNVDGKEVVRVSFNPDERGADDGN